MAGGKETTRQKMINIMYLVLLAMLALNVSDTILNAFKNINDSLNTSKVNVNTSVGQLFTAFENTKLKDEPERAKPIYAKAVQARNLADDLNNYIDQLKKEFEKEGQGYSEETGDLVERANMDIAQGIMINKKKGIELKNKINQTREKLIALVDEKDRSSLTFSLEANDPKKRIEGKKTWEDVNFGEGTPLTAAMTILTKIQADTKNAESDVIKKIFGKMDQALVTLDQFAAVAVAPTSYVLRGQPYTAEVFLTASDSKSSPNITVNGSALAVKDGKGQYSVSTGKEGVYSWVGTIRVKQTDGTVKEYKTPEQKYQVAEPSAVVSPDKMNVFYIGVPNPVSVSAPGIPKENLRVSMTGGSISGSNGKYTVRVTTPGEAKVAVSAELAPGKMQNIGTTTFRVKRIPPPKAKFAGKTGGSLSSVVIKSQNRVFATLDNFDFDAKFEVTRFTLIIARPRADAVVLSTTGGELSGAMRAAMAGVIPGTRVIFDNITAVGPDGVQQALDPIALSAN
ncbi:gliding motility protein GldM [Pedobacter sp. HMF7647]|uniref:Gliding motility protein GldM n=1 Tax=Hufsiella arboris TaxID=2695275 RepID=A0A7K1Y451_9SPHI|nr:gliding motility protein GldM [Hufsiella arboris]MXV49366.1 gliding motility protein GldM [Hufsiella arboris]